MNLLFDQQEADLRHKQLEDLQDKYRRAILDDKPFSEVREIYEELKRSKDKLQEASDEENPLKAS